MILGCFHAALILIPEGLDNLPIGWKFWPEMIGAFLLLCLDVMVFSAKWKKFLLPYRWWRTVHRLTGYLLFPLLLLHILYVSDSFEESIPQYGLLVVAFTLSLLIIVTKTAQQKRKKLGYQLYSMEAATPDVVKLQVESKSPFLHLPGQFAFLTLSTNHYSGEPLPFTIASISNDQRLLTFFIKRSGDWTAAIAPDERYKVTLLGPYGQFSHLNIVAPNSLKQPSELIFLAGGVGITPILAILHHLSSQKLQPSVRLVWYLKNRQQMFLHNELDNLERSLEHLKLTTHFTEEDGRLNSESLTELLHGVSSKAHSSFFFNVEHIYSKTHGLFEDYSGSIHFDPKNLKESSFEFEIKVKSINTFNAKRDKHLLSADFFDESQFPTLKFVSSSISPAGENRYNVEGTFNVKGKDYPLTLPLTLVGVKDHPMMKGKKVAGFDGTLTIDRLAHGGGGGKFYDLGVVGKDVEIIVSLEVLSK